MPINNYAKMRRVNSLIRKKMEEFGFYGIRMFGHSRFQKDIYGWDGMAKYPEDVDGSFSVVWIQCKTGYIKKKEKRNLADFCSKSGQLGLLAEYIKREVRLTPLGFEIDFINLGKKK
jgi:phage terminase large subunit-like protein